MRIAIDARMYGAQVTGIGTYAEGLINALRKDTRHEYVVIVRSREAAALTNALPRLSVVVSNIPWYSWSEQISFPAVLLRQRCDLVHFLNFNVPLRFRQPFVVTIHDLTPLQFPGQRQARSRLHRAAYHSVLRHAVLGSRQIIAVSEHTRQHLIMVYPAAAPNISVIYPGLSPAFRDATKNGIVYDYLGRLGIRQPYIFFTGVWREHKNIPGLLQAFRILRASYGRDDLQLVIGGDRHGADAKVTEMLAEFPSGQVITPGFIPERELRSFYHYAAATVIPSFREGFGLLGIESLSCGTPVAASRTTAVPEILGSHAHYFDPYQPDDMARTIHRLLNIDRKQAALAAAGILPRFTWEAAAKATIEAYERAGTILSS